jgi:hypothetical protein
MVKTNVTYCIGATLAADLGNMKETATTAPAPMAMLRGVRAGISEVSVVVDVDA